MAASSLSYDRNIKLPIYADAHIPEVWIEDLENDLLHIYRNPSGETYATFFALRVGDYASPLAFPDVTLNVEELLSTDCAD